MDKAGLRAQIRGRRSEGHTPSGGFADRVLAETPNGTVCCYVSLPGEPPTDDIIDGLLDRGDEVYLPIAMPAGRMLWTPAETTRPRLAWGLKGTAAPPAAVDLPAPDAVIVPALAVDVAGNRLGQGGGYYDRFLPSVSARSIALIWHDELLAEVVTDPHDVRVDVWVIADE